MKKEDTQQLISNQELDGVEMKVEELPTFHNIDDRNSNHFPTHTHLSTLCPTSTEDEKNEKEPPEPEETFSPGNMCEAMGGGEKNEVKFVDKRNTLYSRLHSTNTEERRIARFQVQFGVARGLEQLCRCDCYQEMLVKLNPHNIVITSQDDVFLKLHEDSQQSLNEPTQQKTEVAVQKDDSARRWMAPEVVNQNGTEEKTPINEKAAAIETGDVPFGELDEINAQRQLGLGGKAEHEQSWIRTERACGRVFGCGPFAEALVQKDL
ncbi:hypothetical protein BLNAU_25068 [Blattamonas nauphoetae]|uniref:Uncharacterized protein n=1 Tax=Blattamonas nauphoetae TaxID=2049346 RepID=A0ABQ9WKM7_9EUKA|nr:hypothetical protein BLNAU_25068 [Blattamonas nauphoetae]